MNAITINNKPAKIILTILVVLAVFGTSYYFLAPGQEFKTQATHALFLDVSALESYADIIVVGKLQDAISNYKPTIINNPQGRLQDFYTITDVLYSKVLKGNPGGGKTISVLQPAALLDTPYKSQKDMIAHGEFTLMENGKQYLLFLKRTDLPDVYSIISLEQGKFNVDNLDLKEKKMAQGNSQYNALRESVVNRFKSEFAGAN